MLEDGSGLVEGRSILRPFGMVEGLRAELMISREGKERLRRVKQSKRREE